MTARRLTTFLAAGTLVLAACGGSTPADEATPVAEQGSPAAGTAGSVTDAPLDTAADAAAEQPPAPTIDVTTPAPTAPAAGTAPAAPATDPVVVPAALDLTAPLVTGGEIELGAFAGRPVLLWFWAPW